MPGPPPPAARRHLLLAAAVAAASLAAGAAVELHGLGSRHPFVPPAGLEGRVASVTNAAGALQVWGAAGVRGRRLVVLSGQWSKPPGRWTHGSTEAGPRAQANEEPDPFDPRSALFNATRFGIARTLDVVMPPAALTRRLGEVSGSKGLVREEGGFRLAYEGVERRFSTPRGFHPPREPVLALVEPSWFGEGSPGDPLGWLASHGVTWDLALLALEDPEASGEERMAARAFARAEGAPILEMPR